MDNTSAPTRGARLTCTFLVAGVLAIGTLNWLRRTTPAPAPLAWADRVTPSPKNGPRS